jgi:serine/threonine protein kinase/tetratricopeptide (TPR) repeat protein
MPGKSQDDDLIMTLVNRALSRPAAERESYLREECAADLDLFRQAWSYVEWEQRMQGFLLDPLYKPREPFDAGSAPPALAPGSQLGAYRIEARIGAGGMGVVYRGYDPRLDRQVAIKLLPANIASYEHARERLRREALATAALDHPFICKIFEIGEHGNAHFLVMEYIPGETLHRRLLAGPLSLPDALRLGGEVAEALEHAHARGFLHRDLKPANIMLTEQGHVKLMDFGLAKQFAHFPRASGTEGRELTARGTILGTPEYMSPEQVKGLPLDARSDLFAFGAILAEMITGRSPFRKPSMAETLAAVVGETPDLSGDIPQSVVLLLRRLLAKAVEDRYASIGDVRADMARLSAPPEVDARQQTPSHRVLLVGRNAELGQLTQRLDEALGGRGSLVMIGGEPGIGKTHLASALLEAARLRGAYVVTGHCYEMEGSPPYVPFIEILEYSARSVPRDSFRFAIGDDAPEVAKLMPHLRRTFPDIPPALELPPEQQRRFLFNAYRDFVERSARVTPIVALFEDLHWADEPTLLLLQHLAQAVAGMPVLLIGTYRDAELEAGRPFAGILESFLRNRLAARILLRRLSAVEVEQMLEGLSSLPPPPPLTRFVFEVTEGNPFFVEEVFRDLAEEGKLFDRDGTFHSVVEVDRLRVPKGVRAVLERRLERLSGESRRVLTTAAVIGRIFSLELIEELEKAGPDAAIEALEEAEHAHLVEVEAAGRNPRYRFVHELVRQTLIEAISLPRRQRLHALVAAALERVHGSSIDSQIPTLAHHLYQAGAAVDPEKAIHFLSEAAKRAGSAAAHEEALLHLNNILSLLEGECSVRVSDLHACRGAALRSLSRNDEAVEEYERALAILDTLGEHVRFIETGIRLGFMHGWANRIREAGALADRAARHAQHAPPAIQCVNLAAHALTASALGEMDRAFDLFEERLKIPDSNLTPDAMCTVANCEMHMWYHAGRMDRCEAGARKGARLAEQSGDLWLRANIALGLFVPPLFCGRPGQAEKLILEELPNMTRVGHDDAKFNALCYLACAHVARGDLDGAVRTAREALAFGRSHHAGWMFQAETTLAGILLYRDQTAEAFSLLAKAAAVPARYYRGFPDGVLALGMAANDAEGAEAAVTVARQFLPRPGVSRGLGAWYAVLSLVEALGLRGRRDEAGRLQAEAEKIAAEWDCTALGFPARTAAGIAAACAGDWARAEEHHRASVARMDAVPYVTAQSIARFWYAEMLAERHGAGDIESARSLLEETISATGTIGLGLYGRLARRKLSQIS